IGTASTGGVVPALLMNDGAGGNTLAYAEAVAERCSDKQLWPSDRTWRAHARSISAEMHSGFAALRAGMLMNCRAMGRKVPLTPALEQDIARVIAIWSDCAALAGGGRLYGRNGCSDALYAPVTQRF